MIFFVVGRRESYTVSEVCCPSNLPCSCVESTGGENNSALGNLTPSQPRQVSVVHAVSFACLLQSFEDHRRESKFVRERANSREATTTAYHCVHASEGSRGRTA